MCCILVIGSRRRRLRLSRHFFPVNQCGFASCKKSTKISFSSFKQSFTANVNNLKRRYWYIYILTVNNISYMQDAIYVVFLFFVFFLGGEWVWLNNPISLTKKKDKRKVFEELYSQHITPHVIYYVLHYQPRQNQLDYIVLYIIKYYPLQVFLRGFDGIRWCQRRSSAATDSVNFNVSSSSTAGRATKASSWS